MRKLFIIIISFIMVASAGFFVLFESRNNFQYTLGRPEKNIPSAQDFEFFIISDPHYLSDSVHDNKDAFQQFLNYGDKLIQYSDELLGAVAMDIAKEKPDFIVFTGDMTCNGDFESHKALAAKLNEIEEMGTCVFVIPGNHDVLNPMARQFFEKTFWETDYITRDMFADIYGNFGYNGAISRDSGSLSYLAMATEKYWLLMLDSAIYQNNIKENRPEIGGQLSEKTIKWIKQCAALAEENNANLIAVMHHSFLHHSDIINENYTIADNEQITDLLISSNIKVALTGHTHIQDIKSKTVNNNTLYDITTGCLSVYPNQYGKMRFKSNEGYHYETVKVHMNEYAQKNNLQDENLQNFDQLSVDFFVRQCCKRQNQCLSAIEGLSDDDLSKVKDTVSKINLRYFAGLRNEKMDDLLETEGYKILEQLEHCFIHDYVYNTLTDERSDHNVLFIPINEIKQ